MKKNTVRTSKTIARCLACGVDIVAQLEVSVNVDIGEVHSHDDDRPASVPVVATGNVTGLSVAHDCIPRVSR